MRRLLVLFLTTTFHGAELSMVQSYTYHAVSVFYPSLSELLSPESDSLISRSASA